MNLANKITLIRIGLIPLFILFYYPYPVALAEQYSLFKFLDQYGTSVAVGLFILASATDKLDGYVARKYNQITNVGKLLDPLADKLLITAALLLLVQNNSIPAVFAIVIIAREIVITMLRSNAAAQGVAVQADNWGKYKLVAQVVAISIALLDNYPFRLFTDIPVHLILMTIAVILTLYSGVNYIVKNRETFSVL